MGCGCQSCGPACGDKPARPGQNSCGCSKSEVRTAGAWGGRDGTRVAAAGTQPWPLNFQRGLVVDPAKHRSEMGVRCGDGPPPDPGLLVARSNIARGSSTGPQAEWLLPGLALPFPSGGNCASVSLSDAVRAAKGEVIRPTLQAVSAPQLPSVMGIGEEVVAGGKAAELRRQRLAADRERRREGQAPYRSGTAEPSSRFIAKVDDGGKSANLVNICGLNDLQFTYRTVSFKVDCTWYQEWLADWQILRESAILDESGVASTLGYGKVSAPDTVLANVWGTFPAQFEAAARVRGMSTATLFERFDSLIGCYILPTSGYDFRSNYEFWAYEKGAPRMVHRWTAAMLFTYIGFVRYWESTAVDVPSTAFEMGNLGSFETFLGEILLGNAADGRWTGSDEVWVKPWNTCSLRMHYRTGLHFPASQAGISFDVENPTEACAENIDGKCLSWLHENECSGLWWNEWTPGWDARLDCVSSGTGDCEEPDQPGCSFNAYHRKFTVTLHPAGLAFQALTIDKELHLARLAYDYSRWLHLNGDEDGAIEMKATADKLGRYALTVLAHNARLWIHEIGHAFLGTSPRTYDWEGPHCSYSCSNDIAGEFWLCRVRGLLGLPWKKYEPATSGDDFATDTYATVNAFNDSCSSDPHAVHSWRCDVWENGVPGQWANFCSTSCMPEMPGWWGSDAYRLFTPPHDRTEDTWDWRPVTIDEALRCYI